MHDPFVFKIFRPSEWATFRAAGAWSGSPDDVEDGFVHLSTAAQIAGTLEKHFANDPGLVIAAFETQTLGDPLTWEPSRGGALFPHLYAPLEEVNMLWHEDLSDDADGRDAAAVAAIISHKTRMVR
ncbi:MAG: DUF952 domain-containing protein [Pseudomonadota bacterium]